MNKKKMRKKENCEREIGNLREREIGNLRETEREREKGNLLERNRERERKIGNLPKRNKHGWICSGILDEQIRLE